jgi:glycosyltransferase involved in cell wall biosynthesis
VNATSQTAALPDKSQPELSVVVTPGRAELLRGCLESLARQSAPRGGFEVLVVCNGPDDATGEAVRTFEGRLNVRYMVEPLRGRSHARNAGWLAARGRYVTFLDDDAHACPDWVELILAAIRTPQPPPIFDGPCAPFYTAPRPAWFQDAYAAHDVDGAARPLAAPLPATMNMAVRADLRRRIGGFDPRYGSDEEVRHGEDRELQMRALRVLGEGCIAWLPQMRIEHLVPRSRMTVAWILRSRWRTARPQTRLEARYGVLRPAIAPALRHAAANAAITLWVLATCPLRSRARYPFWQNHIVERVTPALGGLAAALERLRMALCGTGRTEDIDEVVRSNMLAWDEAPRPMDERFEPGLVSVVVPTYNRADLILHSLESVRAQSYRPIEVIVVDDGGTDDTEQVVAEFARGCEPGLSVRYVRQQNQGAPAARTRGLLESRGEFIQFLDSDDLLEYSKLAAQAEAMRADPALQYVFSRWELVDRSGGPLPRAWPRDFRAEPDCIMDLLCTNKLGRNVPLCTVNGLYRRSLCVRMGPWTGGAEQCDDRVYNIRIFVLRAPVCHLPKVHAWARLHAGDRMTAHFAEPPALRSSRRGWRLIQATLERAGLLTRTRRRLLAHTYYHLARPALIAGDAELGRALLADGLAVAPLSDVWLKLQAVRLLYGVLGVRAANRLLALRMRARGLGR